MSRFRRSVFIYGSLHFAKEFNSALGKDMLYNGSGGMPFGNDSLCDKEKIRAYGVPRNDAFRNRYIPCGRLRYLYGNLTQAK